MATAILTPTRHESFSSSIRDSEEEEGENRPVMKSVVIQKGEKRERNRSMSPARPLSSRDEHKRGGEWVEKVGSPETKNKKEEKSILTKTGGAYIPPARLRMMQAEISDKTSVVYQRMAWEALKKSINGLINKVNTSNIADIVRELFQENIVRGRGLLARSVISAQSASPTFTHVYAALVAIINTKFPQTGELIAKRLVIQFQKAFRRNDKICVSLVRFIAHLVNQQIVHELLALELLTVLLEDPTSDSVEVAVGFLKECGMKLTELSPRGILGVFESLKSILHDAQIDVRVQYMIEVMFAIRKDKFNDYPAITEGLDLIQEEDQITHLISLDDELNGEDMINVFRADDQYQENEDRYRAIKEEILGEGSSSDEGEGDSDSDSEEDEDGEEGEEGGEMKIIDETQTDLLSLRRTIYLTIMSSLDFEECAHKLLKMEFRPGQEMEVANMIIECCSQERSYQRFYGLLGERFCHLEEKWVEKFDTAFQEQYSTVHRLETNKLRNTAKFFAQLFYTDALPWTSLSCIHLNEDETNSSSRIFIKILFQELAEYMGLTKLNQRLKDPTLSAFFEGLLPRDNPRNTRFGINFFTSIGLGGLTDDLREHLKNAPKTIMSQDQEIDSDSSSSDEDSSSSEEEEETSSSSSEEERTRKRRNHDKMRKETKRHEKQRNSKRSPSISEQRLKKREVKERSSPPRGRRRERSPKRQEREEERSSPPRRRERSPKRQEREEERSSPPRRRERSPKRQEREEEQSSPPRRRERSPKRQEREEEERSSPLRRRDRERSSHKEQRVSSNRHKEQSPKRREERSKRRERSRTPPRKERSPHRREKSKRERSQSPRQRRERSHS